MGLDWMGQKERTAFAAAFCRRVVRLSVFRRQFANSEMLLLLWTAANEQTAVCGAPLFFPHFRYDLAMLTGSPVGFSDALRINVIILYFVGSERSDQSMIHDNFCN